MSKFYSEFFGGTIEAVKVESLAAIVEDCRYVYTDYDAGVDLYEGESGSFFAVPL